MISTEGRTLGPSKSLRLSKNKRAHIYTDSRYAFATLHVHGALYKERGLLTAGGKGIKNQNEILKLPEAVWEPKEIAVIHCKGHQKGKDSVSEGNQRADAAAKLAAKGQAAPARIRLAPNYLNLQSTLLRRRNGPSKNEGRLRCLLCAQNNAEQGPVGPIGVQRCGQAPFEDLEVDFTEIGPSRGNKYLLVFAPFQAESRHIPLTPKRREKSLRHC
ncbi:hypothetical protein QTO34_007929 [Cnephaeus nilssonii]|uniref:RNase H type-1 domain-containing protein n=1 Tax=Cnephaeus nilssonii TaxID=3371016 RepID=A0AA40I9D4_CNENI|nr:hypothetical protein QTO34_007929 [Eptesicus nilssonii]